MPAIFTDTQESLAELGTSMGADGLRVARQVLDGAALPDEPTAALLSGFSGLAVAEEHGGAGGALVDLAVLVHALGTTLVPTPFVLHVAAIQAAHGAGLDVGAATAGGELWTLALADGPGRHWGRWSADLAAAEIAKPAVVHGAAADAVVAAGAGDRLAVADVATRRARESADRGARVADVTAMPRAGADAPGAAAALRRSLVVVAAALSGIGHGALAAGADYARQRQQFGQPIGRFQGVAHQLADAFVDVEAGWNLVLYAAWAIDEQRTDATVSAHAAYAKAAAAAISAAERALQVHGGIGVTWEADAHLFLRAAFGAQAVLDSAAVHARCAGESSVGRALTATGGYTDQLV